MGQVVDVDTKANFQCNVTHNAIENVTCDRYLTMACQPPIVGCDNGVYCARNNTVRHVYLLEAG